MRRLLGAIAILFAGSQLYAGQSSLQISAPRLRVATLDQTVSTYPLVIQVPNGGASVLGGTVTLNFNSSGGGSQGAIVFYNGAVSLGTATAISAGTNVTFVMNNTTLTISATGGGGGGGSGGVWIATTAFQFFQPVTTAVFVGAFIDSAAYTGTGIATITISGTPFWNYSSSADIRMNGFSTQNSTTDTRISQVGLDTGTLKTNFYSYSSTADARMTTIGLNTGTVNTNFYAYTSTADSRMSTIGLNTGTVAGNLYAYESTADVRMNGFSTQNSTTDSRISDIGVATGTIYSTVGTPLTFGGSSITALTQGANITLTMTGSSIAIAGSAGAASGGDSFGAHRATQTVDLSSNNIVAVGTITVTGDVVSTNTVKAGTVTVTGFLSAAEMNITSSFSAVNANISSLTVTNVNITSTVFMTLSDMPYAGASTSPIVLVSTGSTPYLFLNRNGHLNLGAPPDPVFDMPLVVYSTMAPAGPVTHEYNGALFNFPIKRPNSGSTTNENMVGLKALLDMRVGGSLATNGNYSVIQASVTNAIVPIQVGDLRGLDAQINWLGTSITLGSIVGSNVNILYPVTAGAINTGIFGSKVKSLIPAGTSTNPNTYGFYADLADSGSGASASHSVYGLYLNTLTSSNGNAYGVYVVPTVVNYFAGSVGISTNSPTRKFEVYNSSIASVGATAGLYLTTTTNKLVDMPFFSTSLGSTTIKGSVDVDSITVLSTITIGSANGGILNVRTATVTINNQTYYWPGVVTAGQCFALNADGKTIQFAACSGGTPPVGDSFGSHIATQVSNLNNFGIVNVSSLSDVTKINGQIRVSSYPYVDLPIKAASLRGINQTTTTAGGSDGLAISSIAANRILNFDFFPLPNASTRAAYFQTKLPDSWDGSTIAFNLDWYASSGTADGSLNAVFALQAVALSSGSAINSIYGSSVAVVSTYRAVNQIARTPTSASITVGGNPTKNCMVYFQLLRLGADGRDTVTAFANVMGLNIRYREISNSDEERSP